VIYSVLCFHLQRVYDITVAV